jgi:hypothetical protein
MKKSDQVTLAALQGALTTHLTAIRSHGPNS